jgi:hypothetical protein
MRNLRHELEMMVVAVNKPLKQKVTEMTLIELLRNSHPIYCSSFASMLLDKKTISKDEAKEFIKLV